MREPHAINHSNPRAALAHLVNSRANHFRITLASIRHAICNDTRLDHLQEIFEARSRFVTSALKIDNN